MFLFSCAALDLNSSIIIFLLHVVNLVSIFVAQSPSSLDFLLAFLLLSYFVIVFVFFFVSGHKKAFFAAAVILGLIALLPFLLLLLPGALNPLNKRR